MIRPGGIWLLVGLLVVTVIVFATIRVATDLPHVATGTVPPASEFANRYARYPWLAYAHVTPGVIYLLLAPVQLWRGFRVRHYSWHRRIGRVALVAGLAAGVFDILFGSSSRSVACSRRRHRSCAAPGCWPNVRRAPWPTRWWCASTRRSRS